MIAAIDALALGGLDVPPSQDEAIVQGLLRFVLEGDIEARERAGHRAVALARYSTSLLRAFQIYAEAKQSNNEYMLKVAYHGLLALAENNPLDDPLDEGS